MSDLYVVKVNIEELKETYQKKIATIEKNIAKMSDENIKQVKKMLIKSKNLLINLIKQKKNMK